MTRLEAGFQGSWEQFMVLCTNQTEFLWVDDDIVDKKPAEEEQGAVEIELQHPSAVSEQPAGCCWEWNQCSCLTTSVRWH